MARLWQSGFESNSNTANVEFTNKFDTAATIQSAITRGGSFAGKISGMTSLTLAGWIYQFKATTSPGPFYLRFYIYITTYPTANNTIACFSAEVNSTPNLEGGGLMLSSTGTIILTDSVTNFGATSTLSLNTWYSVELFADPTNSTLTARLNGTQFATTSIASITNCKSLYVGGNIQLENQTTGVWYFDDIAVNDNTTTDQNSWCGEGSIVHLLPNAQGDNNAFSTNVGGTAGAANNYTRVNEVTPNDATSYNGDTVSGNIDDFKISSSSAIGNTSTINTVMVGVRYRAVVASAESPFVVRIKKASGGTVSESSAITPNSTTWKTNANAAPNNYPLILYRDPDGVSWTADKLSSAQIGYRITSTGTNATDISTVWLSVEYTPGGTGFIHQGGIKPRRPFINWNHSLAKGLVYDIPLFEGGGVTPWEIVQNLPFTLAGSPTWVLDRFGWGLKFNGSSDSLTSSIISAGIVNQLDNWTMDCLWKANSISGSEMGIFSVNNTSDTAGGTIEFDGDNQLAILLNGVNRTDVATTGQTVVGTIYHTIMTRYMGTTTMYLNGVALSSTVPNIPGMPATNICIGSARQNATTLWRFFNGTVYSARYWNRGFTPNDAINLYENPFQIYKQPSFYQALNSIGSAPGIIFAGFKTLLGAGQA